jgi:ribosomal protein S18 acetylase RimI-like enzyme
MSSVIAAPWPSAVARHAADGGHVRVRSYKGYFVDLFVRQSNAVAIQMYKNFGYSIYRQVMGYYSGEEDAYGASDCASLLHASRAHASPREFRYAKGALERRR